MATAEEALSKWLERHNAITAWQKRINENVTVEAYIINGRLALVMRFRSGGWDIFTPTETSKIVETLADAAVRLKVQA